MRRATASVHWTVWAARPRPCLRARSHRKPVRRREPPASTDASLGFGEYRGMAEHQAYPRVPAQRSSARCFRGDLAGLGRARQQASVGCATPPGRHGSALAWVGVLTDLRPGRHEAYAAWRGRSGSSRGSVRQSSRTRPSWRVMDADGPGGWTGARSLRRGRPPGVPACGCVWSTRTTSGFTLASQSAGALRRRGPVGPPDSDPVRRIASHPPVATTYNRPRPPHGSMCRHWMTGSRRLSPRPSAIESTQAAGRNVPLYMTAGTARQPE